MAKYKEFFVDLMMTEELSLPVPSDGDNVESFKDGLTMFLSFTAFGLLPIGGYVCASAMSPGLTQQSLFVVAYVLIVINLFSLGAFKAKFHDRLYLRSGLETLVLGGACAAIAFYIGRGIAEYAAVVELFQVV